MAGLVRSSLLRLSRHRIRCSNSLNADVLSGSSYSALIQLQPHSCSLRDRDGQYQRCYAKASVKTSGKSKNPKDTATLIPGSQVPLADNPTAQAEYERAKEKMEAASKWFKAECTSLETRGSGRVTTALLDAVRVDLGEEGGRVRLIECATVGIREGITLLVTAFDGKVSLAFKSRKIPQFYSELQNLKAIEAAIYEAKLPGITPQRQDARTLRIPVPRYGAGILWSI